MIGVALPSLPGAQCDAMDSKMCYSCMIERAAELAAAGCSSKQVREFCLSE